MQVLPKPILEAEGNRKGIYSQQIDIFYQASERSTHLPDKKNYCVYNSGITDALCHQVNWLERAMKHILCYEDF